MAPPQGLNASDRRFLAGIIHQIWRTCQVVVAVAMERGSQEAAQALDDLAEWAAGQRRQLTPRSARRPRMVTPPGLRIGRELLDDAETICRAVTRMLAALERAAPDADVTEEALGIIEGVLSWTALMAQQLGITRHLRPRTLWFEH